METLNTKLLKCDNINTDTLTTSDSITINSNNINEVLASNAIISGVNAPNISTLNGQDLSVNTINVDNFNTNCKIIIENDATFQTYTHHPIYQLQNRNLSYGDCTILYDLHAKVSIYYDYGSVYGSFIENDIECRAYAYFNNKTNRANITTSFFVIPHGFYNQTRSIGIMSITMCGMKFKTLSHIYEQYPNVEVSSSLTLNNDPLKPYLAGIAYCGNIENIYQYHIDVGATNTYVVSIASNHQGDYYILSKSNGDRESFTNNEKVLKFKDIDMIYK